MESSQSALWGYEFLSAKARRFFSWADKVAYTRYWPLVTHHLPGELNDISHMLSHLGEQTRVRASQLDTQLGYAALACPTAVHSFHGPDPHTDPLSQYHVVHLSFRAEDSSELTRAYLNDSTAVQ